MMEPFLKAIYLKVDMRRYGMLLLLLVIVVAWLHVYLILPMMEECGMGLHKAQ